LVFIFLKGDKSLPLLLLLLLLVDLYLSYLLYFKLLPVLGFIIKLFFLGLSKEYPYPLSISRYFYLMILDDGDNGDVGDVGD